MKITFLKVVLGIVVFSFLFFILSAIPMGEAKRMTVSKFGYGTVLSSFVALYAAVWIIGMVWFSTQTYKVSIFPWRDRNGYFMVRAKNKVTDENWIKEYVRKHNLVDVQDPVEILSIKRVANSNLSDDAEFCYGTQNHLLV